MHLFQQGNKFGDGAKPDHIVNFKSENMIVCEPAQTNLLTHASACWLFAIICGLRNKLEFAV